MTPSTSSKKPGKDSNSGFVKLYLIGYNFIEAIGWTFLLYQLIDFHLFNRQDSLYETVKWPLIVFQNAAVLEVVHAAIRIVPSSPIITAMQVASRVIVVCGVMVSTQAARETVGLNLALFAWSITEVIRYTNYTLNLLGGGVPYIITWLRYTTFIILYPIGVTGELLCIYAAQEEVGRTKIFTVEMPNPVNFVFDYQKFLWFLVLAYTPLFPKLYLHMFTLRRKVLGGSQDKKVKKSA